MERPRIIGADCLRNFTNTAHQTLGQAAENALRYEHATITPLDLLASCLDNQDVLSYIREEGYDREAIVKRVGEFNELLRIADKTQKEVGLAAWTKQILKNAETLGKEDGASQYTTLYIWKGAFQALPWLSRVILQPQPIIAEK